MPSSKKPLLIFDFDGTLANTLETGIEIFNEVAGEYSLNKVTLEEVRELRKLNTRALLDHLGISRLLAVRLGAHIRKLLHQRMDQVELFPGIGDAIRKLSDEQFSLGILSSNSADNVRVFLQRFGLLDCFQFIEAGVSLFGKPQRIKNVLRRVRVDADDAIYIGDETRDMEAARVAAISAVAVCWGANGREAMLTEGPQYCIDEPYQLVDCARSFHENR